MDTLKKLWAKRPHPSDRRWTGPVFGMLRNARTPRIDGGPARFMIALLLSLTACQPREPEPLSIGKIWKAQTVREGDQVVYTQGAASNTQPGYANFRLNLTDPQKAVLIDRDGRTVTGTWSVSTDNKRLILENLKPIPTNTIGTIEYYITTPPTPGTLPLQRTAESRKTGNTVNDYQLVPLE